MNCYNSLNISTNHYPFGSLMPNRYSGGSDYRYAYQGSEKDDEITGVEGSHFTTYFREYDTRLGRTWSLDPVFQPWQSSYTSMDNNPIWFNDPMGDRIKYRGSRKSFRRAARDDANFKKNWKKWKKNIGVKKI